MIKELNIVVSPAQANDLTMLKKMVSENLKIEISRMRFGDPVLGTEFLDDIF